MTEFRTLRRLSMLALGLALTTSFLSGCATTAEPAVAPGPLAQPATPPAAPVPAPPEAVPAVAPIAGTEVAAPAEVEAQHSIYFSANSNAIAAPEQDKLDEVAAALKADKTLIVTLVGRANEFGSRSYRLAVADARVEAVSASLKKLGVKPRQIRKRAFGERLPGNCQSAACLQQMRRVDLVFANRK